MNLQSLKPAATGNSKLVICSVPFVMAMFILVLMTVVMMIYNDGVLFMSGYF